MYGFQIRSTTAWATALICMILPKIKRVHCHYHVELCTGYFPKPRHLVFFPQDATIWLREKLLVELFFHVISIFCLHRALDKIHTCKLFAYGKIRKNQRRKKVLVRKKKKKKKKMPKEERKSTILSRKKNSFVKATSTSGAQRWPFWPGFSFSFGNFPCYCVVLNASLSDLDKKKVCAMG